jgi:hypothetical protein
MPPSADVYTDIIHHLQQIEQSAARLASVAQYLEKDEIRQRAEQHEQAVVFAVIQLTATVERLAKEAGQ